MGTTSLLLLGLVLFLLLGVVLLWWAGAARERLGVPAGHILYADDDAAWFPQAESLYAEDLQLVGKPDYLVEQPDGSIVPVEVKSAAAPPAPYEGHVLQLAAYCFLVEENFGVRPPFGIIQYDDDAFEIAYTDDLEEGVLDVLAEMRADRYAGDLDRDHDDSRRCARCGFREACEQALA